MAAAPDAAALLTDGLVCLGLGLLLAMLRDFAGLLLGNGRLLCAVWDTVALALAAVLLCGFAAGSSAIGVARWYMAGAMAAGAWGWYFGLSQIIHATLHLAVKLLFAPALAMYRQMLFPLKTSVLAYFKRRKQEILLKKQKKAKKLLQKPQKVLYN